MELEPSLAGVDMVRSDAVNKLHPKYFSSLCSVKMCFICMLDDHSVCVNSIH